MLDGGWRKCYAPQEPEGIASVMAVSGIVLL